MTTLNQFTVHRIDGAELALSTLTGQVVLIVNGLAVLGFPCNQFGGQDPGSPEQIQSFCQLNYGVTFPMMAKVCVNGDQADPLFQWLKAEAPGLLGSQGIKWNFTKFLVGRDGRVIRRYAPQDTPSKLARDIEAALQA
ncbi:MAG: glutathione peroxidase [Burkholderiaceae bacterium]|nr:glutathione peroxidase [Burkholderiaceae bacterium]